MAKEDILEIPDFVSPEEPCTFEGLRDILMKEINLLRSGKVSIARARVVSQLSRRVIEATTLDMYQQGLLSHGGIKRLMSENVQG